MRGAPWTAIACALGGLVGPDVAIARATTADARPRRLFDLTSPTSQGGFGSALAVAGDALVVGGIGRGEVSGRVSVFDLGSGRLTLLLASPGTDDRFGERVAATGDAIVVSAPGNHVVYLFDRAGRLKASLPSDLVEPDEDAFGVRLAAGGGYVAVGGSTSGIRLFDATTGAFVTTVPVPEDWTDGAALALSGHTLFVGVAGWTSADDDIGRLYAFDARTGALRWVRHGPLDRPGFGEALAVGGRSLVVGAWRDGRGRACAGLHDAATGDVRKIYRAPGARSGFGSAVSIRGDRILVGAPRAAHGRGRAYLYSRASGARLATYDAGVTRGGAGTTVALARGRVIVGAPAREHVAVFRARVP